ncbi:DUF4259 domain-containing protein [Pseudonocardia sp. TRM90224]|uniref:DUF4259 domain-containing protein n=1 Tax=Pseudonocardia sp. TRM90224 TaxID=2812678 RepID=UPI001E5E14C2|nr:DUF4259 domain-containing protein [Pseudonocardia sp. TRM90224]
MGTWGTGSFDNDNAADFAGDLDDATAADRPALLREALDNAASADHLDSYEADLAIAAAAIVAAQLPDGPRPNPNYGPNFVAAGEPVAVDPDLFALARAALTRILDDEENEWLELWQESGDADAAIAVVEALRNALPA